MRCLACDSALTEAQLRAKMPICKEYWDLCGRCLTSIQGERARENDQPTARDVIREGDRKLDADILAEYRLLDLG